MADQHFSTAAALLFDLSGVLYEGKQGIDGATATIRTLRSEGYCLRFITNTASQAKSDILMQLHAMGFEVSAAELFTATDAALGYIQAQQLNPYCIVHPNIQPFFTGFQPPYDSVLVSDARAGLHYAALNRAFQLCWAGKRLIGVGNNRYFKADGELQLDAGPFIQMLSEVSGQTAEIVGKPSAEFFHAVVDSTGFAADQCLMIGDDVMGDIDGALRAGLQACLVRTGKYQPNDELLLNPPCAVIDSIEALRLHSTLPFIEHENANRPWHH